MLRHTRIEQDGEPVQRCFPVLNRHRPFLADVAQRQIIQLINASSLGNEPRLLVMVRRSAVTTRVPGQISKPNSMETQGVGKVFRPVGKHTAFIDRRNEDDRH
jgi:hypothetical protein